MLNDKIEDRRLGKLGGPQRLFGSFFLIGFLTFLAGDLWIAFRSYGRVFSTVADVPPTEVGLVLGTSSRLRDGHENPFFAGRIAAAGELYRAGKVRHLLLSGDNSEENYDEPSDMRAALMKQGVPESAMTLDYAGFRTLDSFARARKVFGVTRVTIISDDFHVARAVLLARHFGIDACAYSSAPVPFRWSQKTRLREIAARYAALIDVYMLRRQPHFLGPRTDLPSSS